MTRRFAVGATTVIAKRFVRLANVDGYARCQPVWAFAVPNKDSWREQWVGVAYKQLNGKYMVGGMPYTCLPTLKDCANTFAYFPDPDARAKVEAI